MSLLATQAGRKLTAPGHGVRAAAGATFENPGTGAVLESLSSDAGSSLYQSITSYASLPANPYGS